MQGASPDAGVTMSIKIGEPTSPTFQQPLALLSDCHRRVEHFLGLLRRVAHDADGGPLNPLQREALETALRYFREAAPKHTADEEESLFPRLRVLGTSEALAVLGKIRALEADHKTAGHSHKAVEIFGKLWLIQNHLGPDEIAAMKTHLDSLHALYSAHIAIEDAEVFPAAARLLRNDDLDAVGREMAARRGQPFDRPGFAKSPSTFPYSTNHAAA